MEVGVETVIADSLVVAGRETLYEHPGTGAVTELVEIVRRDRLEPTIAEAALAMGARDPGPDGQARLVFNTRSQRAAVVLAGAVAHVRRWRGAGTRAADPPRHPRPHGEGRARRLELAQDRRGPLAHALET